MPPKVEIFAHGLKIPLTFVDLVRAGQQRLFIWGWAEYTSTYGDTSRHVTRFCNEVVITGVRQASPESREVAVHFQIFGAFNTAD